MKNTKKITITIDPLGYAYLLELLEMAEITADYYDDDDNRAAVDTIKEEIVYWAGDNVAQAKEAGDAEGLLRLKKIFREAGLDDADDDANAPEEAAPKKAEEILREEDPEYRIWDDALIWLDGDRTGWNVVEEAARIASLPTYKTNLHAAGRAYGMAEALAITARIEGANADWWLGFIEDFAADNYDNGARIEE